jgi:hypothetical protein
MKIFAILSASAFGQDLGDATAIAAGVDASLQGYLSCVARGEESAQCDGDCATAFLGFIGNSESCSGANTDRACCTEADVCGDDGLIATVEDITCLSFPTPLEFSCCGGEDGTEDPEDPTNPEDPAEDDSLEEDHPEDGHTHDHTDDHTEDDHQTGEGDHNSASSISFSVAAFVLSKLF